MNKECHTLVADPTSASYIGMSFLLTMIKQAVVAIYTLQSVTELQLINKNIVHHDALYTQHPKKKKYTLNVASCISTCEALVHKNEGEAKMNVSGAFHRTPFIQV